jgi:hypothetical protein
MVTNLPFKAARNVTNLCPPTWRNQRRQRKTHFSDAEIEPLITEVEAKQPYTHLSAEHTCWSPQQWLDE